MSQSCGYEAPPPPSSAGTAAARTPCCFSSAKLSATKVSVASWLGARSAKRTPSARIRPGQSTGPAGCIGADARDIWRSSSRVLFPIIVAACGSRSSPKSGLARTAASCQPPRAKEPGGSNARLWPVLPGREGGGGFLRALDRTGRARAARRQHPVQPHPPRRAVDVAHPPERAAEAAGGKRRGDAPVRRARPRIPSDPGRQGNRPDDPLPRRMGPALVPLEIRGG